MNLAYFISPHGFGHAARAAAVMTALQKLIPNVHFEIFTRVPAWFFAESGVVSFSYHETLTDIGLVQKDALVEDLPKTVEFLNDFLPFDPALVETLARQVDQAASRLILCDIAPLGITVAKKAGLPACLIENFTWDWIYAGYSDYADGLRPHIDYLGPIFAAADYHIQTEPICWPQVAAMTVAPVSRARQTEADTVRARLGVSTQEKLVLMSMGGAGWDFGFLLEARLDPAVRLIIPGGQDQLPAAPHLIALPRRSHFFHPDLVNACDAVIGKVGYSTLAEVYQAGVPFGFVGRAAFRESPVLEDFVRNHLPSLRFSPAEFQSHQWSIKLPQLLGLAKNRQPSVNGAETIAHFVGNLVR
jgi:UDP:flavonoid glycosyltransferase YjiC (YdhE family)